MNCFFKCSSSSAATDDRSLLGHCSAVRHGDMRDNLRANQSESHHFRLCGFHLKGCASQRLHSLMVCTTLGRVSYLIWYLFTSASFRSKVKFKINTVNTSVQGNMLAFARALAFYLFHLFLTARRCSKTNARTLVLQTDSLNSLKPLSFNPLLSVMSLLI